MKTFRRILAGTALVLVVVVGWYLYQVLPKIPDRPFEPPTGPFGVGTREYGWTDSSRGEPYTRASDDHRRIVVQIWYPTDRGVAGDTARYLARPREFASRAGAFAARKARTNAVVEAPVAGTGRFPVLLYNHGGAWTRWSATFAAEWLASHGYVVASVEHFGFNQTVRYPDGSRFVADTLVFPKETGDGKQDAFAGWAFLDDPVFGIWRDDARFALDRIEALDREPGPFQQRLDLDRVGAFGWSFGGALAIQLSADDARVKAAVDHDGQLFGDVRERGTTRPVLQLYHGVDDALAYPEEERPVVRELVALVASWDSVARLRSSGDWYGITLAGSDHGDFSDLSLFYPRGPERIDPRRAHAIINAYTLAFFDRYLKGETPGLLSTPDSPYPEVSMRFWPGDSARLVASP